MNTHCGPSDEGVEGGGGDGGSAVTEETVKTEGTAVAEKKETEENGRVAVASDPVAEREVRTWL